MRHILLFVFLLLLPGFIHALQNEKLDSLNKLLNEKPKNEHAKIYNDLFWYHWDEGNIKEAISNAQKAFDVADKVDNQLEQYHALMNIMRGNLELGLSNTAIQSGIKALELAIGNNNLSFAASTHNQLGIAYIRISLFDKALEHYLGALSIIEDTLPDTSPEDNLRYKALVMNNIGSIYSEMNNLSKALDFYNQALEIRKKQNNPDGLASSLQNVGVIYESMGDNDLALEYYLEALEIRNSLDNKNDIAELLMNIGIIHISNKHFDLAEQKLLESIEIFRENRNQHFIAYNNIMLGKLYFEMNQHETAYPYIIEGLEIAKNINNKVYESDAYELLSEYYTAKNDYHKAFEFQQNQLNLKDSIFGDELAQKVAEMQTRFDTEKKEKEIEILARDKEINLLQIKRQSAQLYTLFGFVALIILIFVLFYNRIRLKRINERTALEKQNLETEQRLLRSQMNPHFIFNSMNSIQSFISGNDSFTAMTYLSKFAQLMRNILENSRKSLITLLDESNTLELYMELEQTRFNKKFEFIIDIDPELSPEEVYIPPMLIQPFVENAIKHGLRNKEGLGLLEVEFRTNYNLLNCIIRDNGIGREKAEALKKESSKSHRSQGMEVTRERLSAISRSKNINVNFEITDLKKENGTAAGTQVVVNLPFETN